MVFASFEETLNFHVLIIKLGSPIDMLFKQRDN